MIDQQAKIDELKKKFDDSKERWHTGGESNEVIFSADALISFLLDVLNEKE